MTGDIFITRAAAVTVDSSDRIRRDAAIAIRGREIVALAGRSAQSREPERTLFVLRQGLDTSALIEGSRSQ